MGNIRPLALLVVVVLAALSVLPQNGGQNAQQPTQPAASTLQSMPQASTAPSPSAMAASDESLVLREGTPIRLKFAQNLSSKTAAEDDPVNFVLAEDLVVADLVVAKAGAFATGVVSHAKRAGMLGKAGELNVRLSHLRCGDRKIKIRGSQGKEGQGKEGTAVALTVLFGPIGLIKHGKNVEVKEGAPLVAYVDEDVVLPRGLKAN